MRATLARLYVAQRRYDKAIPLLTDLVNQEPGWQDGPMLLVEAYAGARAGRRRDRAGSRRRRRTIRGCYPTLADFYERERRWKDAAGAYAQALAGDAAQRRAEDAVRVGAAERRRPRRPSRRRATC